jgi:hypothetical protein
MPHIKFLSSSPDLSLGDFTALVIGQGATGIKDARFLIP